MYLSDLHIKEKEPEKSIAYPGPRPVDASEMPLVLSLLELLKDGTRLNFIIEKDGVFWRGRHDKQAVDGTWFRLRRMAEKTPHLNELPSPMPSIIKDILLSNSIGRGGLIHIAGGPGCGKTTTGSATIKSRLMESGGVAYTVENPPELPLNGWHGPGYCTQTWVAGDDGEDWEESMRGVLRSQPTGTKLMLYVGEVNDPATARAMLRAASNGFLVVSTGFGSDIISGIDTFFQLIGHEHAPAFAAALRVIVYQTIQNGRFGVQVLTSEGPSSPVGNIIRSGHLAQLQNEINFQMNHVKAGRPLLA